MNERIQKLAMSVQCENHWTEEDIEKFAELIIQECIRCCDDVDTIQKHYEKYHLDMELGASQCIEVIKKHFGVEQ